MFDSLVRYVGALSKRKDFTTEGTEGAEKGGENTAVAQVTLCESQASAGHRNRPPKFLGGLNPFLNYRFHVRQGFFVGLTIRGADGEFWNFGNEGLVCGTPVNDDFVFRHSYLPGEPIANYNIPDLFDLVWLALIADRLQVEDFLDALAGKNMVASFDALLESQAFK
jgi:hypothetical protein